MVPAITFAYLSHPQPRRYLGLRMPGKNIQVLISLLLIIGAMPILMWIEHAIGKINFGQQVRDAQAMQENVMKAFMQMPSVGDFIATFFVMAIVPGVGEELFFRGVLMRFAKQRSRHMLMPVLFSAIVFAYAHYNVYGSVSIFIAGVLLACIYNLTGSIWCSIAAHIFFNGSQIILHYVAGRSASVTAFMASDTLPFGYVATGAALFGFSLWWLIKNRTPLPPNWADDFSRQELEALKKENNNRLF